MNLETIQGKQLQKIRRLTQELLLNLTEAELNNEVVSIELDFLLESVTRELQSRSDQVDRLKQTYEVVHKLATWDDEGGAQNDKLTWY